MANRALGPRLSDDGTCGDPKEPWQEKAIDKVQNLYSAAYQERVLISPQVLNFRTPGRDAIVPWLAGLAEKICRVGDAEAGEMAKMFMAPQRGNGADNVDGLYHVSPFAFSLDEDSMWKGHPDNKKLCRITRSMLNGYDLSEPILSRSNDLGDRDGSGVLLHRLLFGDGMCRGLAVLFAFNLILEWVNDDKFAPSPNMDRVFRSLMRVPVAFEARKKGLTNDQHLVDCAVKQNVKAQMTQILHTLQWIHIFMHLHKTPTAEAISYKSPNFRKTCGDEMVEIMKNFFFAYDAHADVKAYDLVAPAPLKKRRTSRAGRCAGAALEQDSGPTEDTLRIGAVRMKAMTKVLKFIAPEALNRWQLHIMMTGSAWKYSALQDATAASDHIWPGGRF